MIELYDVPPHAGGIHRSGWPAIMAELQAYNCTPEDAASGYGTSKVMFVDDFVDRHFRRGEHAHKQPIRRPWAGIFHYPCNIDSPLAGDREQTPATLFKNPIFKASLPYLRLAIVFTQDHARNLAALFRKQRVSATVEHMPHSTRCAPITFPGVQLVPEWNGFDSQRISQVGFFIRDTRAIFRVRNKLVGAWSLERSKPHLSWMVNRDLKLRQLRGKSEVTTESTVKQHERFSDTEYDAWLCNSTAVLTWPFAAVACNVIVECLSMAVPLIVPRHDAIVEYLGREYPMYFDTDKQLSKAIDIVAERCQAAHEHLKRRRSILPTLSGMAQQINDLCQKAL